MNDTRAESMIVVASAIGLSWETPRGIIGLPGQRYRRSPADIGNCIAVFQRLHPTTARRILEFQRSRGPGAGRRH